MTSYSDSIMDWTRNQSNTEKKEMTLFIWKPVSGHFQRHIWKLVAVVYEVTFAVYEVGQALDFEWILVQVFGLLIIFSFNMEDIPP